MIGAGPANRTVRILVHELAHTHGISYVQYARAQAEVLVATVTHIVLSQARLDVSAATIPYIAGWGENGAVDAIRQYATTIDAVARQLETALSPDEPAAIEAVAA